MEPVRRAALVEATIAELGTAGTLDVTVAQIARRAGMSSALAHHYFGGKEDIFAAAMRHVLSELRSDVVTRLQSSRTARARVDAIIAASFAPASFDPVTVKAWMLFYVFAQTNPKAARLLHVYQRRLHANLAHALVGLADDPRTMAETLAALIDGYYLRAALPGTRSAAEAERHVLQAARQVLQC